MTTFDRKKIKCVICGKRSKHSIVMSSNQLGSPDLDLRPPIMLRSTISFWIQRCPKCGYCNSDISKEIPGAANLIRDDDYQSILFDKNLPEVARHFRCHGILARNHNKATALLAHVNSAWVCDDKNMDEKAVECRRFAIEIMETFKPFKDNEDDINKGLIYIDLLRRVGEFEKARLECENLLTFQKFVEEVEAILRYQLELIHINDTNVHQIQDAES